MATATKISQAAAIAAVDAVTALLGSGSLKIYTGAQPATPDTAVTDQILLATLNLSATAFSGAVFASGSATATNAAISPDSSADATGDAAWFRALSSADAAVIDGSIGTVDADMIMTNVSVQAGASFNILTWTISLPVE